MKKNILKRYDSIYKNVGQQAEVDLAYTLTGKPKKADNRKGGADVLSYQVKTFRATLCKGTDPKAVLEEYKDAERFAFVDSEESTWYDLSKAEFLEFVRAFARVERESNKNGGSAKLRLNGQKKAQRAWLMAKA